MYIDSTFLNNAFSSAQVTALCATSGELDTTIELAEAAVEAALQLGGYVGAVPSTNYATVGDVPNAIKLAAFGAWLEIAHLRKNKSLPPTADRYTRLVDDIGTGKLEIPGVTKSASRAVGGVSISDNPDTTADPDSPSHVFTRTTLRGM